MYYVCKNFYLKISLKKPVYIILFVFVCLIKSEAQQMPNFSQYIMNGFLVNPALAGYDGYTVVNFTSRQQWLGSYESPQTYSLSAQGRVMSRSYIIKRQMLTKKMIFKPSRKGRTGLGASIDNDSHGIFSRTSMNLSYAHHINFPNAQLSLGLAFNLSQFMINDRELRFRDEKDKAIFAGLGDPAYSPDFSTGIFYYDRKKMAGFSISNLVQAWVKFGNNKIQNYRLRRHYYFIGSYKFNTHPNYILEPSFLFKTTENLIPQFDISLRTYYHDQYWFGLSYRTVSSVVTLVGIQKNKLYMGYAFDYSFSNFQISALGTHEITMALRFGDSVRRYRWMNRF